MARAEPAVAALIQQEAGQVEIAALAGLAVQLHQRRLDLGVAGRGRPLAGAEGRVDVVGEAAGDVQQAIAAGRAVVRDGRLEQVASAVELVAVPEVDPAPARLGDGVVRVEVAVRFLGRLDDVDRLLDQRFQIGVGLPSQLEGGRLDPLVDVRVHEDRAAIPFGGVRRPRASGSRSCRPAPASGTRAAAPTRG